MQSILRLRIVEFFDSLRNELDLFTETKIAENAELESFWNKRRQQQIDAIGHIEQAKLANSNNLLNKECQESEMMSQVMSHGFCFLLEYGGMSFVARVDRYVEQTEIEILRKIIESQRLNSHQRIQLFTDNAQHSNIEPIVFEAAAKLDQYLTVDCAVVDMTWWFDNEYHFDKVEIELSLNYWEKEFVCPVRIHTLEITLSFLGYHSQKVETLERLIKIIQERFKQARFMIIKLYFNDWFLDFETAVTRSISAIKWDERTTPVIFFNLENWWPSNPYSEIIDQGHWYKTVKFYLCKGWFNKINWNHMYELKLSNCGPIQDLDFSSVRSLKSCEFSGCFLDQTDWSFLDPIRPFLEHLTFEDNRISRLSWRMFNRMTKLKSLTINEDRICGVELDASHQLFADLAQLKSLEIDVNNYLLEQEWHFELQALEKLSLRIIFYKDCRINLSFKLPNLSHLELKSYHEKENLNLTRKLASLAHVEKLTTELGLLRTRMFRGFRCSSLFVMSNYKDNLIDSDLFVGLDNLKSIEFEHYEPIITDDAFGALTNLQSIKLKGYDTEWLRGNQRKFNGLRSLSTIYLQTFYSSEYGCKSWSLFFFENLNKIVLVNVFE